MKKVYTRINHSELRTVNINTGEVVSGVSEVKCSDIDAFIMCFLKSIPEITNLDGNSIRVLLWCWKLSNFNINLPTGNTISNNQVFRNSVRENGGDLTDSVITKAFHILAKKGLLIKQCKGQYTLNPEYFFKGTLSNRSSLKYTLSYNPEE